ncbi:hypothetical protein E0M27_19530 [Bacillus mycoides]|nr:hypothetical protein EXW46_10965 [Bacillus mycoides]TBX54545.1 hypothetical protein E0M27_19530 [Bacillus mycoides]
MILSLPVLWQLFLPRYLWAVKLPPQNSDGAKKLGGRSTARKRPIGSTNNQWGMNKQNPH